MMLVPAPWRAAFGQTKPYKIGALQSAVRRGRSGRQDCAGRRADGGRPHQQGGRRQRPADRADRRGRRVQARCRPPQDRASWSVEDKIDAHVGGFLSNICLACMPVLGGGQDRQHDQRVPRHHADHDQVQPLQLPAFTTTHRRRRSPSRPIWSTRWARNGTSPMPTIPGASRPRDAYAAGDQEGGRRGRRRPPASRSAPPT